MYLYMDAVSLCADARGTVFFSGNTEKKHSSKNILAKEIVNKIYKRL